MAGHQRSDAIDRIIGNTLEDLFNIRFEVSPN